MADQRKSTTPAPRVATAQPEFGPDALTDQCSPAGPPQDIDTLNDAGLTPEAKSLSDLRQQGRQLRNRGIK